MPDEPGPVAVLGADPMSHVMVDSLMQAGIRTVACRRDCDFVRARALPKLGATVSATVRDAASRAGVAITMASDVDAVLRIADADGMLDALPPGAIWAQMSTIGVAGTERVAELAERRRPDLTFVDAPVSATLGAADDGHVTIFASGPVSAKARIVPVFDALGQRTIWMGPVGLGSRMKVVDNTLLAFIAEAVRLANLLAVTTEAVTDRDAGGRLASRRVTAEPRHDAHGADAPAPSLATVLEGVGLALDAADHDRSGVLDQLTGSWRNADRELDKLDRILGNPS